MGILNFWCIHKESHHNPLLHLQVKEEHGESVSQNFTHAALCKPIGFPFNCTPSSLLSMTDAEWRLLLGDCPHPPGHLHHPPTGGHSGREFLITSAFASLNPFWTPCKVGTFRTINTKNMQNQKGSHSTITVLKCSALKHMSCSLNGVHSTFN